MLRANRQPSNVQQLRSSTYLTWSS